MIEVRWLKRKTGQQVINKYGFYEDGVVTVLQYRQQIDTTIRAGMWNNSDIVKTANYQWSDWQDVPTVVESAIHPLQSYQPNKCPKCGLEIKGAMSYTCTNNPCPTFGSST